MKPSSKGINIIIGLPSFMEADSIGFVTRQVDQGLQQYFPGLNAVIVNVDNNSEDNTRDTFLSTETVTDKKYFSTPKFVRGKGNNFMNLFRFAKRHLSTLRAVAVFDTDLKSITPEWVKHMVEAVLGGYDFAIPRYSRHQFDGTITNHLCYPLLYGLLGRDIRQPIGGEYALSPTMLKHLLDIKWPPAAKLYGVDIFMTLSAVFGGFSICEVGLGVKVHKASAPKLGPMFTQVVSTLFSMLINHREKWLDPTVVVTDTIPLFYKTGLESPQDMAVDLESLRERMKGELDAMEPILKKHLDEYLYAVMRKITDRDSFGFHSQLWAQMVYIFIYAYDRGSAKEKKDIIEALKPLHLARSIAFDCESEKQPIDVAEGLVHEQASVFAGMKPFLRGLYYADIQRKINAGKV